MKRALMEVDGDRKDITVDYGAGEVWINEERVAKWCGDHLNVRGEAQKVRPRIDELMAQRFVDPDGLSE